MTNDNDNPTGFGIRERQIHFYEDAARNNSWVNLDTGKATLTGRVVRYDSKEHILILNPSVDYIYSSDGRKRVALVAGDSEIDLKVCSPGKKFVTDEQGAKSRVACYNRELKLDKPQTFWEEEFSDWVI